MTLLINGDSFEILPTFEYEEFNCIITDPPYDMTDEQKVIFIDSCRNCCSGNIVVFQSPKNNIIPQTLTDEILFWVKTPSTKNYINHCGNFVEEIRVIRKGLTFNCLHWSQMTGVYDDRLVYPTVHPYEKPISLIERLVRIYSNPGDKILDPFMGSGTCGIACNHLERSFWGIEKNPQFFELAQVRIEQDQV